MAEIKDAYPLTKLQAGMLFHCELEPESAVYVNVNSLHLRAPFDERALRQTIDRLVARHAVLRTSFHVAEFSEPLQLVHDDAEVALGIDDLRGFGEADQEAHIAAWLERDRYTPFELITMPARTPFAAHASKAGRTCWLGATIRARSGVSGSAAISG